MLPPIPSLELTMEQSMSLQVFSNKISAYAKPENYRTWSSAETGEVLANMVEIILNLKKENLRRQNAYKALLKEWPTTGNNS